MAICNDDYLPGDKVELFSIFFNSVRSGFVSDTVSGATKYASNILIPQEGTIKRHHKKGDPVRLGELVASGIVGGIDIAIILEEWTVDEDGAFDLSHIPYADRKH